MAGIISNVDSDVQKLRKLKNEIEEVKKALKGINITVDIDIAKSLQSQLTSLIGQYDALVDKIAAAEGKIMLSTKRINDAAEKIIQAQEKVSKTAGISIQAGNANTQTNTVETANIQAQAKAYEDLKAEINDILGTRDANVKRMVEEMNAIRLINAEIKKITKLQGESSSLSSAQQERLERLNNSLLTHKTVLSEVRQTLNNNVKLDNAAATSMNGLSQSLSRMRIAYRELTEEERNSPIGKELLASINQADAKIKELDATIGNHQRNVGNYSKQWNGLSMSIQQVGRELPSLAYGPKVFFSAISNNLPILADEIERARKEYDLLKKSGQSATPVWKQVVSSLFSWQSALTVGITLLTLYGDKVVDWVGSLFNANEALKETKRFQDALNQSMRDANKDIIDETTKLKILYRAATDAKKSVEERTFAVRELKKEFPSYFGLMDDEKIKAGKAADAYKVLTDNIIASVKARRTEKLIVSEQNKYLDYLGETTIAYLKMQKAQDKLKQSESIYNKIKTKENKEIYEIDKRTLERRKEEYDKARAKSQKQAENVYNLTTTINASKLYGNPKDRDKATVENKDFWTAQKNNAETALDSIASAQKELMDAGKFEGIPKDVVNQYKQAIKLKAEAEKELKVYDSSSKQESQAEILRQQQEKYNLLLDKQALEQKRSVEDLENQTEQARINAMKEGNIRTLAQMKLDHKKEMQQLDRQEEDLLRKRIDSEKAKFDAKEDEKAAKDSNYKKKIFDGSNITLSPSEQNAFKTQKMYLSTQQANEIQALLDKERQAWNEYLSEYGTFQEKKEAINSEYNRKISEASAKGEKASLEKEKQNRLKEVEFDELKSSINFADIFGNLDAQSTDAIKILRDKLKDVIEKSAKDLKPTDLKSLQDALQNMDLKIAERNPFGELKNGIDDYKSSVNAVIKAQEDLNKVQQGGEVIIGTYIDQTGKICTKLLTQAQAEKNLADAQRKKKESQEKLTKSINSIGEQGQQVVQAGNNLVDMLTNLGVKIPESVAGALSGVGQIMDGLASIDVTKPMSIITGVTGMLAGFTKTIGSIFGIGGADYSGYEKMKAQYETLISIWDELITKKMNYIDIDYGEEALKAAKEAEQLVNIQIGRQRQLIKQLASSGAGAGSHSLGYRIDHRLSKEDYQRLSGLTGENITAEWQLWDLSPEQIEKILADEKLVSVLDTVNKDFVTYLQNIVAYGEQLDEITEKVKEAITGMSFDEFRSGYANLLSDLDSTNEDFANNFEKYLQKAIFESLLANKYKDQIQELYDTWAEYGKDGLTSDEAQKLRDMQQGLTNNLLAEREKLMNDFGWTTGESTSQSTTSRGFGTEMTHEDAGELSGRFTALQITGEEIKNQAIIQTQSLNLLTTKADAILSVNTETRNIADEARDLIAQSYLELVQISENTGAIVKPIQQMQKDIAEVKKNTSKL